jgi:hypothetical protein
MTPADDPTPPHIAVELSYKGAPQAGRGRFQTPRAGVPVTRYVKPWSRLKVACTVVGIIISGAVAGTGAVAAVLSRPTRTELAPHMATVADHEKRLSVLEERSWWIVDTLAKTADHLRVPRLPVPPDPADAGGDTP